MHGGLLRLSERDDKLLGGGVKQIKFSPLENSLVAARVYVCVCVCLSGNDSRLFPSVVVLNKCAEASD